jgi:hypothetical protein
MSRKSLLLIVCGTVFVLAASLGCLLLATGVQAHSASYGTSGDVACGSVLRPEHSSVDSEFRSDEIVPPDEFTRATAVVEACRNARRTQALYAKGAFGADLLALIVGFLVLCYPSVVHSVRSMTRQATVG